MDWKGWSKAWVRHPGPLFVVAPQAVLVGFDPGIVGSVALQERCCVWGQQEGRTLDDRQVFAQDLSVAEGDVTRSINSQDILTKRTNGFLP